MADEAQAYHIGAIRALLLAAFTAEELRRFCQDRPVLRPVLDDLGPEASLQQIAGQLITHCEKQILFKELLDGVKEVNPRQYARYAPRIFGSLAPIAAAPKRGETGTQESMPAGAPSPLDADVPVPTRPPATGAEGSKQLPRAEGATPSAQPVHGRLVQILRDPAWQGIAALVAVVALGVTLCIWFWPDIRSSLFPAPTVSGSETPPPTSSTLPGPTWTATPAVAASKAFTSTPSYTPATTLTPSPSPITTLTPTPTPSPTNTFTPSPPTPLPIVGYSLPRNQPQDVTYDGSTLWALFKDSLVRLETVESEKRFRGAETVVLYEDELTYVSGNSLAWDESRQKFWVVRDAPGGLGGGIDLIDHSGHTSNRYGVPEALVGTPRFVAWDGESLWITSDDGSIYKLEAREGHLAIVDSYASAIRVSGLNVASGLAWDGKALWILVGDVLAKLDRVGQPRCKIYLGQSGAPVSWYGWRGLAADGRFLWVATSEENKVYRFDPAACQP